MIWFRLASLVLFTGVALGAFGAHALREKLVPEAKQIYQTGILYQLIHGIALFVVSFMVTMGPPGSPVQLAGFAFLAGVLLFSGSLYLLAVTGVKRWGMVTPVGGLAFLAGWVLLFFSVR